MNNSVNSIEDESSAKERESVLSGKSLRKEQKRKVSLCRRVTIISVSVAIVAFLVFLNIYFKNLYYDLYLLTKEEIDKGNFETFLSIFVINAFLQMCFVPGISFFIMFIGFITKSYLYSVALIYPSSLVICTMTFMLTRYSIKDRLHKWLSRKWYFKVYYDLSITQPWRTSFFLRILLIPVTYKNYLIALMDINYVQFIVPAIPYYLIYFSSYIITGILISNVQDILNGKIPDADKRFYIGLIVFYSTLVLLSLVIVIYLIVLTARTYRKYKESKAKKEAVTDKLLNSAA